MVNRRSPDELSKLKTTPWSEREKPDAGIKFREAIPDDKQVIDKAPPNPRSMRLSVNDFTEYGYSTHCPQCNHMMRYGHTKPGVFHTTICRNRMIKELSATEPGRDRLVLWSENVDKAFAERVGFDDKKSRPQPQASLPAEQGDATTEPEHNNDEAPRSTPYVKQPGSAPRK